MYFPFDNKTLRAGYVAEPRLSCLPLRNTQYAIRKKAGSQLERTLSGGFAKESEPTCETGQCARYHSWTNTSVPGLASVLNIQPSSSSEYMNGVAQSKSHSASSSVILMQPRLMGVPKLLCQ